MSPRQLLALFICLPPGIARGQQNVPLSRLQRASVETVQTDVPIIAGRAIGGVSVDDAGRIYASNFRKKVFRIELDGSVTTLTTDFERASGNTIDSNDDLLQSEYDLNALYRIHEDGSRTLVTDTGLDGPVGVTQHENDIYVVNYLGNTISRVSPEGVTSLFSADPLLNGPNGIVFNAFGEMYVVNLKDNLLLHVDEQGRASILAAIGQSLSFNNAHLVAIGKSLYVSKIFEHRIYRVTLAGEIDFVIGTGAPGVQDGIAPGSARLYHPNGMAVGPDGRTIYTNNYIGAMGTPGSPMRIRTIELW